MSIYSVLLIIMFTAIALLHFYWAVGGRWRIEHAAPVNEQGKRFLNRCVPSLVVGTGLLLFAAYYFILPVGIFSIVGWIIPAIFLIRAIGDFRYIGFTKKVKISRFAELDTKFFSPRCLVIAALGFTVKLLN